MRDYSTPDDMLKRHRPKDGKALVVGSRITDEKVDRRTLYPDAVGLDLELVNGVDFVHNMEIPLQEQYAHIDCCSVMEHCKRPWLMAQNIEAALEPGGTLLLSVPFSWRVHNYPGDYWRFTDQGVIELFPRINWLEIGYLTNGEFRCLTPRKRIEGKKYIAKSEVIGFGKLS